MSRKWPSVLAIGPGAMMLERTPLGPSSTASTAENVSMPAFAADMWAWYGVPEKGSSRLGETLHCRRTSAMESRTDVNIRTVCCSNVLERGLDGVERPHLVHSHVRCKCTTLSLHTVSIFSTVLNAFSDMPLILARKLPVAPKVELKQF